MALFTVWDYVVFFIMLLISAGIGVYYRFTGGKQKTTTEYLLADRSMSILPVSFSLMASFMSAITLLGVSKENYVFGTQFIVINLSYGLATPIAAYWYLPVFYKLQGVSAYGYLEKRFGVETRLAASMAYTLQMVLYMGIVLFAPAIALEAVTGIDRTVAIVSIGVVCTFYSTIGGMKAVLVTDVFQSLLMFAAVFAVIVPAVIHAGGFGAIFQAASEGDRLELWNFDPNPTTRHTWFSLIIGGGFTYLSLYAVNQTQVQRLLTVKDLKSSQKAIWMNWPILSLLSLSTSFSGLCIYYFYRTCDPVAAGRITDRDQIMPLFVVDAMGHLPGLPGLFVSGIFSASLSSISSAVNSLSVVTLEDYIKPLYAKIKRRPMAETYSTLQSKILAGMYGCICLGVAFLAQNMGGVLQASLTVFGVVGGPLFGLFTLGMFTVTASQRGAITGLFTGIIFSLFVGFGGPKPPPKMLPFSTENCSAFVLPNSTLSLVTQTTTEATVIAQRLIAKQAEMADSDYFYLFRISYLWAGVIGFFITFGVGYATTLVLKYFNKEGDNIVLNTEDGSAINYDLFSPPKARALRKLHGKIEHNGAAIATPEGKMLNDTSI